MSETPPHNPPSPQSPVDGWSDRERGPWGSDPLPPPSPSPGRDGSRVTGGELGKFCRTRRRETNNFDKSKACPVPSPRPPSSVDNTLNSLPNKYLQVPSPKNASTTGLPFQWFYEQISSLSLTLVVFARFATLIVR